MEKLVAGYRKFRTDLQPARKSFLAELNQMPQRPKALFITCSDSRIDPNLITGTDPGDLFIIRNAGNLVPPYGHSLGGTTASIEYAVSVLEVKQVIICGHTNCGAMSAMLNPESAAGLPAVTAWLELAESTRRVMETRHADASGDERTELAAYENVLMQLLNVQTHPSVAAAAASGKLELYAWVYFLSSGEVRCYDPNSHKFLPMDEFDPVPLPSVASLPLST